MTNITFSCCITPNNPAVPLGFEIWLDSQMIVDIDHVSEPVKVACEIDDDDGNHTMFFTLKNKKPLHTQVNDQGEIVADAMISISDVVFDDIDCDHLMSTNSVYYHNFNGTSDDIQDEFFRDMGCNGTVEFKFTTPFYLWLLENI